MTRQLVATVHATGAVFGVVLDGSPMTAAQVAALGPWEVRCANGAAAVAAGLAHRFRSSVTIAEVVHRPRRFSTAGKSCRRYPEATHFRVVAAITIEAASAA
jgi:hypothetical protein